MAEQLRFLNFKSKLEAEFSREAEGIEQQFGDKCVSELRQTRHQLARAMAETQNQAGNIDQMQKVIGDVRRENKILTEEIHQLNSKQKLFSFEN